MQDNIKRAGWTELNYGEVRPIFETNQEAWAYDSDSSTARYTPPSQKAASGHGADQNQDLLKAIEMSDIKIFGGTLFRFAGRSGARKIGFAVEGMDEHVAQANAEYYERVGNPWHGTAVFEGASEVGGYHIFTFQIYDDAHSIYEEVHAQGAQQPGHPVVDCDMLMLQLTRTVVWFCKNGGEKYTPLRCICPHTVFLVRDGSQVRTVILPLLAVPHTQLPSEIPNDSVPDVTTDLHSICYLACEVWSGAFDSDGRKVSIPNIPVIRDMLSPIVGSRPSLKEFIQRLQAVASNSPATFGAKQHAPAKVQEKKHAKNYSYLFLRLWRGICSGFSRFKEWICSTEIGTDIVQRCEDSWRELS